jgi:hypothetical protein
MKFFVWRWWYWILSTVSLCRESRHIISSQTFLCITLKPLSFIYKVASVVWWLACLPLDPRFSSSNPAEGDKMLSASSFGGEVKPCMVIYLRFCASSWHSALVLRKPSLAFYLHLLLSEATIWLGLLYVKALWDSKVTRAQLVSIYKWNMSFIALKNVAFPSLHLQVRREWWKIPSKMYC